ncbi:MAG: hypothetical protein QM704_05215 [Anaeromyxobacteraceae bacterium]
MQRLLALSALVAALAAPAAARAEPVVGLRLGWAVPAGQSSKGSDLSAVTSGAAFAEVDAGWRVWRALTIGAYASYGVARIDTYLDNEYEKRGESTRGDVTHVGVRAQWDFRDLAQGLEPWIALGAGWERAGFDVGGAYAYTGWELVRLEAGASWRAWRGLAVGPYVTWSLGRYARLNGGSLPGQAGHAWAAFGLRSTWDF